MNYFEPQVTLLKEIHMDQPDKYFLHVTTMVDQSNYIAMGHDPIPSGLNDEGILPINLKYGIDPNLECLCIATPIVHILEMGPLPSNLIDFAIDVSIDDNLTLTDSSTKPKGKTTVRSSDAKQIERPINS